MDLKTTAALLLLTASLYGQLANAGEVAISQSRLQKMNAAEINYLVDQKIVRFEGDSAFLSLDGLDRLTNALAASNQAEDAKIIRAMAVPYGMTEPEM